MRDDNGGRRMRCSCAHACVCVCVCSGIFFWHAATDGREWRVPPAQRHKRRTAVRRGEGVRGERERENRTRRADQAAARKRMLIRAVTGTKSHHAPLLFLPLSRGDSASPAATSSTSGRASHVHDCLTSLRRIPLITPV